MTPVPTRSNRHAGADSVPPRGAEKDAIRSYRHDAGAYEDATRSYRHDAGAYEDATRSYRHDAMGAKDRSRPVSITSVIARLSTIVLVDDESAVGSKVIERR